MHGLELEIVTPQGVAVHEMGVDKVVVRRCEPRFDEGSQIVVLPRHGPLLVRVPDHEMRYDRRGRTLRIRVSGGFAEVLGDRVTLIVPDAVRG